MLQFVSDTVLVYARPRTNHFLTNVPNEPVEGNNRVVEIVSLEQERLKAVSVFLNNRLGGLIQRHAATFAEDKS